MFSAPACPPSYLYLFGFPLASPIGVVCCHSRFYCCRWLLWARWPSRRASTSLLLSAAPAADTVDASSCGSRVLLLKFTVFFWLFSLGLATVDHLYVYTSACLLCLPLFIPAACMSPLTTSINCRHILHHHIHKSPCCLSSHDPPLSSSSYWCFCLCGLILFLSEHSLFSSNPGCRPTSVCFFLFLFLSIGLLVSMIFFSTFLFLLDW